MLPQPSNSQRREISMAITPPTSDDLAELAARYRFGLDAGDIESLRGFIGGALESYEVVERLYQARLPEPPSRRYQWPGAAENELGAWYVTTDITTTGEGPLAGRRVAIKDNIEIAGLPMMNGSATVQGYVPRRDATVVTRLLDAGATITGKAVCEDLCFSGGSHTAKTGPVRNPWNPAKSAGGSSSGSAALVAAGEADLALGGDQGGSVRIPSAFCGTVGHKPTHGLVPYTGAFPIENTLDHLGPITRTVRDAALMLGVLAGADGLDPRQRAEPPDSDYLAEAEAGIAGLRIAVVAEGFGIPGLSQPGVDETVRAAVAALAAAGGVVSEISIPWHRDGLHVWNVIATDGATNQMIDGNGYGMNSGGLYDPELIAHYAKGRREHAAEMSEPLKLTTLLGRYMIDRGRAGHAHAADRGVDDPARGRQPRRAPRQVPGDDRQHRALRRERSSRDVRAGRPQRRPAGRPHDRRAAFRRRHLPAGRAGVRRGSRRLPGAARPRQRGCVTARASGAA
jgi:amidase